MTHPIACPKTSIWIAANAGSGKTKILVDRLLGLMLQGVLPHNILCITFTKAGASEMTQRVQAKLMEWATLEKTALQHQLESLLGYVPSGDLCDRARALIYAVLEHPIPIHTIHAFCQKLLKQFPLEAQVSPYFTVLDERDARTLMTQAMAQMLGKDAGLKQAFTLLAPSLDKNTFFELLTKIAGDGNQLDIQDPHVLRRHLCALLDIPQDLTPDSLRAKDQEESQEFQQYITRVLPDLDQGSALDQRVGETLRAWIADPRDPEKAQAYKHLFLTQAGEPRQRFATKKIMDQHPDLMDFVNQERDRLLESTDTLNALMVLDHSLALNHLAQGFLETYQSLKTTRNVLDYNDLITQTKRLLGNPELSPWIRYKIDHQIHHILVDEAQDTNYHQWDITRSLTEEFFSDASGQGDARSILTVGDEKQSIYGFQGADPAAFRDMRQAYAQTVQASPHRWHEMALVKSYRSADAILRTVDGLFPHLGQGHVAHKTHPGCVTLWPALSPMDKEAPEPWALTRPLDVPEDADRLAQAIATQVHNWLAQGRQLLGRNRPLEPRDIMVLVRRRNALFESLIRAFQTLGVPVAGPDRFILNDHIAIQDILTLFRFLCLPTDDFNLACLLKSPFFGWSEEALFDLAWERPASLWNVLESRGGDAHETLVQFQESCVQAGPYGIFSETIYGRGHLIKFMERLGPEVREVFEQFGDICLDYESGNGPDLFEFLAWFEEQRPEIKRDTHGNPLNQVRILTVHGAKGLESPLVILPDTTQSPREETDYLIHKGMGCLVWLPRKSQTPLSLQALRDGEATAQLAEYERLLYVAMTRAEEELYITGLAPKSGPQADSWYARLATFMETHGTPIDSGLPGIDGPTRVLADPGFAHRPGVSSHMSEPQRASLPQWGLEKPKPEPLVIPITPSSVEEDTSTPSPHWVPNLQGRARGITLHKILEILVGQPRDQWENLLGDMQDADLKTVAYTLLENPNLAFIFELPGLNEVSFEHHLIRGDTTYVIAGQIDRLVFLPDDRILIIDYKTTPNVPQEIPESHRTQMAYYQAAVQKMYPTKAVNCALLWTHTGNLTYITENLSLGDVA